MSPTPLNDAHRGQPEDLTDANNASPLLRLPGELRNRIYTHALQADDGLEFDEGVDGHTPRFLGRRLSNRDSQGDFNQLKWACRQLYQETLGLEIQVNRVHFVSRGQCVGPGKLLVDFMRNCAASKRGWFRAIALSTADLDTMCRLDESLEPKNVMIALAEFCRQHPHADIRYVVPSMENSEWGGDTTVQGLFLSLVVRGEDLRSVATIGTNPTLKEIEETKWYKDTERAAKLRVTNLRFWLAQPSNLEYFKREVDGAAWLDSEACLEIATKWIDNGI
ncbi:hypothetical protein BKA58DRAFT_36166 [Alternaria rosae]|uniref:uncharacterized protein n=1 Tax=Alternaria rosae TaxID=1187941 RepID=UPI001E8E2151|nr:uncharacterized protein BKA58DRAFT_36166 [Alternaria rosae]KAH6883406.1 hypothetical protein BKA58DRAFT_36166 [Alternaria rosae]